MASATVAKPPQVLRRQRPSLSTRLTTRNGAMDSDDNAADKKLSEPYVKDTAFILRKFNGNNHKASMIVHLHNTYFRFDGQEGSFPFDSEMKFFIEHLKQQTLPHQMMEELLKNSVQFYDGCLIVQVHNHMSSTTQPQPGRSTSDPKDKTVPFSMHNYNEHITPSPYGPYPRKSGDHISASNGTTEETEKKEADKECMPAPVSTNKQAKSGPKITTMVLHPTPLSKHHEMLYLASIPATDSKTNRKGSAFRDGMTPTSAQPPTPLSGMPPTPSGGARAGSAKSQKMMLEPKDYQAFEADMLLATEGPLLLDPARNAEETQKALDTLQHPLHSHPAPSHQTRKRTHAEMAADDAQAAEEERIMLLMDERVKSSQRGAGSSGEGQSGSASLGFSRFKTLEIIKQQQEEKERLRKEEEARAQIEKRNHDTQMAQKRRMLEEQQAARQDHQVKQQILRQRAMAQQAAQNHAHPANAIPPNQQQQFQQASMAQNSSPIVRQQTPMMVSSPMMANSSALPMGGYPMSATASNPGQGSPPRPSSAMHHPNVSMARQMSQQQSQSRHNTPQMAGVTPNMGNAVPIDVNRQMSATPRMAHNSPAQGTPNPAMLTPQMQAMQNLTPQQQQQFIMAQRQRQMLAQQQMQNPGMNQEQMMRQQQQLQAQQQQHQQQQMNPAAYQAQLQRVQQMQQMQHQQQQQQQMRGAEPMQHSPSQNMQMVPGQQVNMSNDPQLQQQQAQRMRAQQIMRNNQMMQQIAAQNGGQIPAQMRQRMNQQQQQNLAQQQMAAMRAQQHLGDTNNPEQYMQNLRNQQALLARMQANRGQQGAMTPGQQQQMMQNAGMNMSQQQMMQQQQQMRSQQSNNDLQQQFAAMQNALNLPGHPQQPSRPGTGMG